MRGAHFSLRRTENISNQPNPSISSVVLSGGVQAVLQGVNLKLTRGNVLALTGPSGEGKSTLASLINRLYEPNQGSITLDDVDIAALNPSWLRRKVIRGIIC